ncbi:hypothetical protein LSI01_04270 [Furfurilactobacillus siliginis]|uniref:Lipoprotein n=1 Tax=Furfurilactobacillus siliginis TaxID=348151 RepID=A0A510VMU3_9LACO|nr:hypothetical protein LSI01_04270 [Furfurilactobacillus siliginis]
MEKSLLLITLVVSILPLSACSSSTNKTSQHNFVPAKLQPVAKTKTTVENSHPKKGDYFNKTECTPFN